MMHKRLRQKIESFFNTISLHISTIATLVKKVPHFSQIEFLRHAYYEATKILLCSLLDLIIIRKPHTKMLLQMLKQVEVAGCQGC